MPEKENQRIAISKRMLKEGLLRLLSQKELSQVSVSELCKEASINRATFYRHYSTPLDVWKDIVRDYSEEIRGFSQKPTSVEEIQRFIEKSCEFFYDHAAIIRTAFQCYTSTDIVNEIIEYIWQPYTEIFNLNDLDEDTRHLTSTFVGFGLYHLFKQWIIDEVPKSPQEVAEIIYKILDIKHIGRRPER